MTFLRIASDKLMVTLSLAEEVLGKNASFKISSGILNSIISFKALVIAEDIKTSKNEMKKITYNEFLRKANQHDWTQASIFHEVQEFMSQMQDKYAANSRIVKTYPATETAPKAILLDLSIPDKVVLDFMVALDTSKNSDGAVFMIECNLCSSGMFQYFDVTPEACFVYASEVYKQLRLH